MHDLAPQFEVEGQVWPGPQSLAVLQVLDEHTPVAVLHVEPLAQSALLVQAQTPATLPGLHIPPVVQPLPADVSE